MPLMGKVGSIKNAIFMSKIVRLLLPTMRYVVFICGKIMKKKSLVQISLWPFRPKNPIIRHYLVQCTNSKRMFTDPEHHQHDDHQ